VFVDSHHHLWDLLRRDQPWTAAPGFAPIRRSFAVDDLARAVAGTGVAQTVLVQVLNDGGETRDLLTMAGTSDLIAGVVGWVDLADPAVAEKLEGLVGVRHQMQAEPDPGVWLARPAVQRGLRALARAGLAYDLMIRPAQYGVAARTVRDHPDLTFVLDHLGKPPIAEGPFEPWASGVRALARHPNLYCKLSGMVTVADHTRWTVADIRPYAEVALEAFGPDRVMFGSDWPVCLLAASYDKVVGLVEELTAGLTTAERNSVLGGTATAVYGLAAAPAVTRESPTTAILRDHYERTDDTAP
jgi:L-fuconolactonase